MRFHYIDIKYTTRLWIVKAKEMFRKYCLGAKPATNDGETPE